MSIAYRPAGSVELDPADPSRLALRGEVDQAVVTDVDVAAFAGATDADLSGLTFLDSSGMSLLVRVAHLNDSGTLRLHGTPDHIARLLAQLGLDAMLPTAG